MHFLTTMYKKCPRSHFCHQQCSLVDKFDVLGWLIGSQAWLTVPWCRSTLRHFTANFQYKCLTISKTISRLTGGSRPLHWRGPAAVSAKNTEQISKLGRFGVLPFGKFFFNIPNAANWKIFTFLSGLWGGMPPLSPPLGATYYVQTVLC